jgi:hypothetical protein
MEGTAKSKAIRAKDYKKRELAKKKKKEANKKNKNRPKEKLELLELPSALRLAHRHQVRPLAR